jgi:hypothetical protein
MVRFLHHLVILDQFGGAAADHEGGALVGPEMIDG